MIEEAGNEVVLWSHLPFFGKFLGDGVLLLWDVTDMTGEAKRNIVYSFDVICTDYERAFLQSLKKTVSKPPLKLRCGIAQGQVTSIAGGSDFVGLCINIASRLQKLGDGAFSFAFTQKGLEPDEAEDWYEDFRLMKIPIRGFLTMSWFMFSSQNFEDCLTIFSCLRRAISRVTSAKPAESRSSGN